ncbi:MAG: hypothetical protein CL949_09935 [Erythrobacter sp.]|nr:hypothetical protein [Erythrobacter sp.]
MPGRQAAETIQPQLQDSATAGQCRWLHPLPCEPEGLPGLQSQAALRTAHDDPQDHAIGPRRRTRPGTRYLQKRRLSRLTSPAKKVEMLFAHLKRILKLDRLRLRGPNGAKDEFHLAAAAQNLRKLAKMRPMPGLATA